MLTSAAEGFAWIESLANLERTPDQRRYKLDGMRRLLNDFDHPQRACAAVHIAGSKGKGSTAAFISAIGVATGLRVGCYASPHVESYWERIRLFPKPLEEPLLLAEMGRIYGYVERIAADARPTTFEVLTLLAYLIFRAARCQLAVIEVGLGGRLDCTNILEPRACVLCPIELEHTEYLGNTLAAIAREKAGIIKPATPLFVARQPAEAMQPIGARAQQLQAPIYPLTELVEHDRVMVRAAATRLHVRLRRPNRQGRRSVSVALRARLGLAGQLQAANAELALLVALYLWPAIPMWQLRRGLARAWLPGRFELLRRRPPLVIDCAHTPSAAAAVGETFRQLYGHDGVLLFGCFAGKDYRRMAAHLAGHFHRIVITRPSDFRPSNGAAMQAAFRKYNPTTQFIADPASALQRAQALSGGQRPILVTGSCYLAGAVRSRIRADTG